MPIGDIRDYIKAWFHAAIKRRSCTDSFSL